MHTRFGFRLLQELVRQSPGRNILFSPTSVELVLALAYNGAAGVTQQAIGHVLEYRGKNAEAVNWDNMNLRTSLERRTPQVESCIANALWADRRHALTDVFLECVKRFYEAEATALDFRDPTAVDTINAWVRRRRTARSQG